MKSPSIIALALTLTTSPVLAGYTTPGTGIVWTLDSLVVHSGGTLTGTFPEYTLTDTLTVAPNDQVSFAPGSIVSVSQGNGKGFTVFGVLRAVGTAVDSIIVKGVVATAGSHRGLRIEDSALDSLCLFSYCRIQDAIEGIHCLNASPTIMNSLFTNNSSNGVRCFGASPLITGCVFTENRQSAITANVGSSPVIEANLFAKNNFQNTGARNQIAVGGQGANNPVIRNNEIFNQNYFRGGGISLVTLTASDVCNALVEGNSIHDNGFGIVVQGLSAGATLRPMIRYNRIERNRINPDSMNSGSGIAIYTGGPTNSPIITGNFIKDNYWGITCVSSSGLSNSPRPVIGDLSNADTSDDGWNIFINNHNGGQTYQLYNNGTQDILAQNNYWGSTDSTVVEQWITHRADSTVFGIVTYQPIGIPGLGGPEVFTVQQISSTQVTLRWRFPSTAPFSSVRVLGGLDTLALTLVATLPGTDTSYTMDFLSTSPHYYALSSFNRLGDGDTTVIGFTPLTNVSEPDDIPEDYMLMQNYPNPFNPGTHFGFRLPAGQAGISHFGFVSLKVYDLLGREVATIVNERKAPGTHLIEWDAEGIASGVYYYRLSVDGWTRTRKLVVLR